MGLDYVVLTSVTRDDLPDGGAAHFASTIEAIRELRPDSLIEVLIPDFQGDERALEAVCRARPAVLNHNVETVARLYATVRPQAGYRRSLDLLKRAKAMDGEMITKSGLMVGLGETWDELAATMKDIRAAGCDLLTIGQYLRPTKRHAAVQRYVEPAEFADYEQAGLEMGFRFVASGPLVRSSYRAAEAFLTGVLAEEANDGDPPDMDRYGKKRQLAVLT